MFDSQSKSAAFETFRITNAYNELVEERLLQLARKLLESDEVNQTLLDERSQVGRALQRGVNTEGATLSEMLSNAAPAGLQLIRLGKVGAIRVTAKNSESFLGALLVRAARESARNQFFGPEPELTARELMTYSLERAKLAGSPDADGYELAIGSDDPEVAENNGSLGIFGPSTLPDLAASRGFAPGGDDHRLDRKRRADEARGRLLAALRDCGAVKASWVRKDAALAQKIDKIITERFAPTASGSNELTVAIREGVATALVSVGETKKTVHRAYTAKIMELAGLVIPRSGDTTGDERVRKAEYRASKTNCGSR